MSRPESPSEQPSESNPLEMRLDEVLAEYMSQCDSGALDDRQAFLLRQPEELRERLMELLGTADWIAQLAGPTAGEESSAAATDLNPPAGPSMQTGASFIDFDDTLPHVSRGDISNSLDATLPVGMPRVQGFVGSIDQAFSVDDPIAEPDADAAPRGSLQRDELAGTHQRSSGTRQLSQPILPCRFGDYMLERVLGRGGMGVVYFGRQIHLDRPVAIKMIRSGALASQEELQRFYTEARSAGRLTHPNIVTVYQCGEHDGHSYFSMDYVPGQDLSRLIADGPLDGKRAARYVRDVARAIQYAHNNGILHRDLKPANVLIDENDQVRITDFGLAKSIGNETGLTATGAALGTPSYMSPEQAAGKVDEQHHATDIYALGAVLFAAVTGQPPFKAPTVVQTIMHVIHRPAPTARSVNSRVDEDLETIIDVCLQKTIDRRYPSAGALADDLDRYLKGSPISARPASQVRRAWYWLLGVPIVGAVLDNRVVDPTPTHRWVQRGLVSLAVLMIFAWTLLAISSTTMFKNRMPRKIRIAAGLEGGDYHTVAAALSEILTANANTKAQHLATAGSSENGARLLSGEVELALMQADGIDSSRIAVLAPLYYEAVHVLARRGTEISKLADLKNRKVMVGPELAGSNAVAQLLLESVNIRLSDIEIDRDDWRILRSDPTVDAAIIVARLGSAGIAELLRTHDYELLAIPNNIQFALDEPSFQALLVDADDYPNCDLPATGVPTVTTTALLVANREAPKVLVQTVLQNLFDPETVNRIGIVSPERAAHWQGLPLHPVAREFFQSYRGLRTN